MYELKMNCELKLNERETKVCPKCKRDLPIEMFYKNKSSKDGLQTYCKECQSEMDRKYKNRIKNENIKNNIYEKQNIKTKVCSKCGRELPIEMFNKDIRNRDGLQFYCKECKKEMIRECREKNKIKNKNNSYKNKLTKVCSKCGRELPIEMFYKDSCSKDGLRYCCKECKSKMQSDWYKRNKMKRRNIEIEKDKLNDKIYDMQNSINELEEKLNQKANEHIKEKKSEYIADIGENIKDIDCVLEKVVSVNKTRRFFSFRKKCVYFYKFIDNDKNIIICEMENLLNIEEGDNANILYGKVKEHKECDGTKQTVISKCKVIKRV